MFYFLRVQNKTSLVSFRFKFAGGNKNIIQKKGKKSVLPAHTAPTTLLALPVDDLEPVDKGWHIARYLQYNRVLVK